MKNNAKVLLLFLAIIGNQFWKFLIFCSSKNVLKDFRLIYDRNWKLKMETILQKGINIPCVRFLKERQ